MGFVDKVKTKLDTVKTTLFGDLNDGQAHGVRAGFVPAFTSSLAVAGAIVLGAPVGAAVAAAVVVASGAVLAVGAGAGGAAAVGAGAAAAAGAGAAGAGGVSPVLAAGALALTAVGCAVLGAEGAQKNRGYNFGKYLAGELAGCVSGAALVFNVAAAHLPQEQPKAPGAESVPSTLHIESRGGELCKDFKIADSEMTDKRGRKVYTLFVPQDCSLVPNP